MLWDETTRTLFCGDLLSQVGDGPAILHDGDVVGAALAAEDMFGQTGLTPATAPTLRRLAALEPRTLAIMHGPAYAGDCAQALLDLADAMEQRRPAGARSGGGRVMPAARTTVGAIDVRDITPIARPEATTLAEAEVARFADALEGLDEREWALPTANTLWDVRAMAGHVLGMTETFTSFRNVARDMRAAARLRGDGPQVDGLTAQQVALTACALDARADRPACGRPGR